MMSSSIYIVAGCKPWAKLAFEEHSTRPPGTWKYVESQDQLTELLNEGQEIAYIFFLHWSHIVPAELIRAYRCVCFHMTDLPFGRGGSPLQNLLVRGIQSTTITSLQMTRKIDAGPIYLKEPFSLEGGTAEEIYLRAMNVSMLMAFRIANERPEPTKQEGEITTFSRRNSAQSELPELETLGSIHDFIRMLDAQGYPAAFLEVGDFKFEFTQSCLYGDRVEAHVTIKRRSDF